MKLTRSILLMLAAVAPLSGCGKAADLTSVAPTLDTTPPPVPEGLTVDPAGGGAYTLSWAPSSAADLATYEVLVYAPDENTLTVTEQTGSQASYALAPVEERTTRYYRVRSVDQSGNRSSLTATFAVELWPAAPETPPSGGADDPPGGGTMEP